ncbi:hypothetical protein D3867_31110 (plasmid) [Azospirillum argentinense]|uniref:Uncharacterized protein n=1 Tax=Azospirillum brasilense TaxID=192 RepID=A0A4D8QH14_AZOBR|nr:hypothetical protein D3867_31110 [Azospirillum argentinense]
MMVFLLMGCGWWQERSMGAAPVERLDEVSSGAAVHRGDGPTLFRAHGAAAGQADGAGCGAMHFVDMAQIGVLVLHE